MKKSLHEDPLQMFSTGQWFNETPMGAIGKVHGDLHASVPAALELHSSGTEEVPDNTPKPAVIVDVIEDNSGLGRREVKLLVNFNVLWDILGVLDPHILFKAVGIVGDGVTKMEDLIHPWESIATKSHFW